MCRCGWLACVYVVGSADDSQFFIMGHSEYDVDTLAKEYFRDAEKGMNPEEIADLFQKNLAGEITAHNGI